MSAAAIAWIVVGVIVVGTFLVMFIRELPAMRRELRIMRM